MQDPCGALRGLTDGMARAANAKLPFRATPAPKSDGPDPCSAARRGLS